MKAGRGGVEFEDLALGDGPAAERGRVVRIRYDIALNRGDKVVDGRVVSFRLGEREVIAGLEYGVEGMRVGGRRRLRVGPHLAYRAAGVPEVIPGDAVLEFDVTLEAVA